MIDRSGPSENAASSGNRKKRRCNSIARASDGIPLAILLATFIWALILPDLAQAQERLSTGRINQVIVEAVRHRPILGPANAPITIRYWVNLYGSSSSLVRSRIKALRNRFPASTRIVALPSFSSRGWSRTIQRLAWAVFRHNGNTRFWEFLDAMWSTPRNKLTRPTVKKLAMDRGGLSATVVERTLKQIDPVKGSLAASVLLYNLTGSVSTNVRQWFLVADKLMQLTYHNTFNAWENLIAARLPRARAKMRQGMSADDVAKWHLGRALAVTNLNKTWKNLSWRRRQSAVLDGHAPLARQAIPPSGLPSKGPASPAVTITIFLAPMRWRTIAALRMAQAIQKTHPHQVAINVYLIPTAGQIRSLKTIKQLLAAHLQGQFWTGIHLLLKRGRLIPRSLRPRSSMVPTSIDWKRLVRDAKGAKVRHLLQKHLSVAHHLGVFWPGAVFVNGILVPGNTAIHPTDMTLFLIALTNRELRGGWLSRLTSHGVP